MARRLSATVAKNNFGRLLDEVAAHGSVEITRHGRVVAVVLAPRAQRGSASRRGGGEGWGRTHMIPTEDARAAQLVRAPAGFDDG